MKREAECLVPGCPVCGFTSIYTDGDVPCSIRCALSVTMDKAVHFGVPAENAVLCVKEEAKFRGLPSEPNVRDIREDSYRYVFVQFRRQSEYWSLDRLLLESGFNVDYVWVSRDDRTKRSRLYRFAPSLLPTLPEFMMDFKVTNLSAREVYSLCKSRPSWCFLPGK